jgi:hypothetical protein
LQWVQGVIVDVGSGMMVDDGSCTLACDVEPFADKLALTQE